MFYIVSCQILTNWRSKGCYSHIPDEQLDELVTAAQNSNPNIGIRMLKGLLQSQGHRVQRERIRQSLIRTDPVGVWQRWTVAIRRRQYHVHSPLALWHIDGNHKLIRLRNKFKIKLLLESENEQWKWWIQLAQFWTLKCISLNVNVHCNHNIVIKKKAWDLNNMNYMHSIASGWVTFRIVQKSPIVLLAWKD